MSFDYSLTYYLSGPMSGIPEYNYPAFESAATLLREQGIKVRSPHELPSPDNAADMDPLELWQHMIDLCIDEMEECQGLILLKGWPHSRGARLEFGVMASKNGPVYFLDEFSLVRMDRG